MLNAVIRFALRYRMLVVVVSLAMLVYGTYLGTQMPIDVFPDLDRPRVIIITECPGLATEEVETLVTQPIEIALLGASGVQAVRSQSTAGLNVIYIEFDWDTDIRAARQTVQERLTTLGGVLPDDILPQMTPPASIMGQIVVAGIYRQQGPNEGELYPIEKTGLMAELVPENGQPTKLFIWRPIDRHRVESWEAVSAEEIRWHSSNDGQDAVTKGPSQATVVLDGKEYDVAFPSEAARRPKLGQPLLRERPTSWSNSNESTVVGQRALAEIPLGGRGEVATRQSWLPRLF